MKIGHEELQIKRTQLVGWTECSEFHRKESEGKRKEVGYPSLKLDLPTLFLFPLSFVFYPQLTTHNLLMLPFKVIRQIVRSLETGKLTHAQIAEKCKVSRNTVTILARSRRSWGQTNKPRKPIRDQRHQSVRSQMRQLVRRCPRCGYNIFPPCRICATRAAIAVDELKKFLQQADTSQPYSSCKKL